MDYVKELKEALLLPPALAGQKALALSEMYDALYNAGVNVSVLRTNAKIKDRFARAVRSNEISIVEILAKRGAK